MMVFVVCALAPISALRHAPREKVNFDFGWRHRLAMDADGRQCPQATPGINYGTGGRKFEKVRSADICCDYCSNTPSCKCWDWNNETIECYVKTDCATKQGEKNRVSGMFPRPEGPPKEAAVHFDDSLWELVDAPHDMLIVQHFNKSSSENQAFIPRNAGWYRKHFYLYKTVSLFLFALIQISKAACGFGGNRTNFHQICSKTREIDSKFAKNDEIWWKNGKNTNEKLTSI